MGFSLVLLQTAELVKATSEVGQRMDPSASFTKALFYLFICLFSRTV